jgi:outer membrane protein assembly factor BamB
MNILKRPFFGYVFMNGLLCCIVFFHCDSFKNEPKLIWSVNIQNTGSFSSPGARDLNGDGVMDIVLGAGANEWLESDNGVLAIDGKTGDLLWKVKSRNQMIGSPLFIDIDNDEIEDVIIGGRSAQLMAINGARGTVLWEYLAHNDTIDYKNDTTILNFFTPQFIPDQNGDGYKDLLVAYGGYVKAGPYDENRPAGLLKIISSKDGTLIASAAMPDGKETYMTAVYFKDETNQEEYILFGTGGETIQGNLYLGSLAELMGGSLEKAVLLVHGKEKGFIAPPVRIDVNADGISDVIINAFEGRTIAIDGKTFNVLWEMSPGDGYETSSMPIPFQMNVAGELITAVFCDFGHGIWPEIHQSEQFFIHGLSGEILHRDSVGNFQFSSALIIEDLKQKQQKILFSINQESLNMEPVSLGNSTYKYSNTLWFFDTYGRESYALFDEYFAGSNPGSTPLLKDIDNNGKVDLIYLHMTNPYNLFDFKGMKIRRYELPDKWQVVRGTYLSE